MVIGLHVVRMKVEVLMLEWVVQVEMVMTDIDMGRVVVMVDI